MIQFLFEVKLLISTGALITHSVSSSWHTCYGIGSSVSLWHRILSAPALEAHSALPCRVLRAHVEEAGGGYLFIF